MEAFTLAPLERGGNYSVILADPPWRFRANSVKNMGRNAGDRKSVV